MTPLFRRLASFVAIVGAAGLATLTSSAAPRADTITLRVDGRSNATPWIAAAGSFVAVAWGATADGNTDVFVAISRSGGRDFGPPVRVNAVAGEARLGGELPPRVELRSRERQDPEVVVLWTARSTTTAIRLARSTDGGRSFTRAITLQAPGAAGDRGWPALALDNTGTAHAVWLDHRRLAAKDDERSQADHKSNAHDGVAMAQRSGLYHAAVGVVASAERELTPGVCYCCKTALAAAPDGGLYAAWRHVYPGNLRDIAFSVSRDGGRSFSAPVRVSEDRWELNGCPDDGPAMAIDASGTVHVIWPTVLSRPTPEGALFYATSRDGQTFTPRVRIPTLGSPKPSHPQIVVDADGRVTVAWDEVIDGVRVALARHLTHAAGNRVTFGEPIKLEEDGSSMYPVLAPASGALVAAWTAGAPGPSVIHVRRVSRDD